jgi:hypothetical protein
LRTGPNRRSVAYHSMNKSIMVMAITIVTSIGIPTAAFASHGSSPTTCEADGYEAGRDGPFSQELYET